MPETISQLKDVLSGATDKEGNVMDVVAVNHVIVSLEGMTIAPEDLHLLQATRIVKKVQDIRRKTKDGKLAKRIKKLVKKWQSLLEYYTPPNSGVVNSKHVNGTVPAENGIDKKSKLNSSPVLPNTNNSSSSIGIQGGLKTKQPLCSVSAVQPTTVTSNNAPHPITDNSRQRMRHMNTTVITFVHPPPPDPMLMVSISRHSVRLKHDVNEINSIPSICISTAEDSHVTSVNSHRDVLFDAPFMDTMNDRNLDELLGIKSDPSTGKITPVDEIITSDGYLLDVNMDYSDFLSTMVEGNDAFGTECAHVQNAGSKVEGVDGFYSGRGIWCDWTQPIPSRDENSVVVLPYVYID